MDLHKGLQRLDGLTPEFKGQISELLAALAEERLYVLVVSGRRTIAEQDKLYAQGRTAPGNIVTNAQAGSSPHNFGYAVDLCPLDIYGNPNWSDTAKFNTIGKTAESLGLVWGGHFKSIKDLPHVESPDWRTAQAQWRAGKLEVA